MRLHTFRERRVDNPKRRVDNPPKVRSSFSSPRRLPHMQRGLFCPPHLVCALRFHQWKKWLTNCIRYRAANRWPECKAAAAWQRRRGSSGGGSGGGGGRCPCMRKPMAPSFILIVSAGQAISSKGPSRAAAAATTPRDRQSPKRRRVRGWLCFGSAAAYYLCVGVPARTDAARPLPPPPPPPLPLPLLTPAPAPPRLQPWRPAAARSSWWRWA